MTGADRKAIALRYAAELGLDGEVLYRATLAAWGCLSPACMPGTFDRALTVAGAVLRSARRTGPELGATSADGITTAGDYARYAAAAMNAATADDTEFLADGATVTAYVHCLAHMSATFAPDESRPYPGDIEPAGYVPCADSGGLEDRIMAEIAGRRERFADSHDSETFIAGLMRALVLAVGRERAEAVFAAHGESY